MKHVRAQTADMHSTRAGLNLRTGGKARKKPSLRIRAISDPEAICSENLHQAERLFATLVARQLVFGNLDLSDICRDREAPADEGTPLPTQLDQTCSKEN